MTREVTLGEEGRVVVPLEVRRALEVEPGDKLLFIVDEGGARLTTRRLEARRLSGVFRLPNGHSLSEELLAERRAEAEAKGW